MENNDLILTPTATRAGEEQELAILFLNIRNFTGLRESQPEQTMTEVVRGLFRAFSQVVKNFGGKEVEVAGDSLYAVFGLQTGLKESVNNAYQAAKEMFYTLELFNEAYAGPCYGGQLEIGIGLHTGKVFVGEFGLDEAPQLSVMGLPVNIASRLQSQTRELNNDLILSEDAYQLLTDDSALVRQQITELQTIRHEQQVRLVGKPYSMYDDIDYFLAIAG